MFVSEDILELPKMAYTESSSNQYDHNSGVEITLSKTSLDNIISKCSLMNIEMTWPTCDILSLETIRHGKLLRVCLNVQKSANQSFCIKFVNSGSEAIDWLMETFEGDSDFKFPKISKNFLAHCPYLPEIDLLISFQEELEVSINRLKSNLVDVVEMGLSDIINIFTHECYRQQFNVLEDIIMVILERWEWIQVHKNLSILTCHLARLIVTDYLNLLDLDDHPQSTENIRVFIHQMLLATDRAAGLCCLARREIWLMLIDVSYSSSLKLYISLHDIQIRLDGEVDSFIIQRIREIVEILS